MRHVAKCDTSFVHSSISSITIRAPRRAIPLGLTGVATARLWCPPTPAGRAVHFTPLRGFYGVRAESSFRWSLFPPNRRDKTARVPCPFPSLARALPSPRNCVAKHLPAEDVTENVSKWRKQHPRNVHSFVFIRAWVAIHNLYSGRRRLEISRRTWSSRSWSRPGNPP